VVIQNLSIEESRLEDIESILEKQQKPEENKGKLRMKNYALIIHSSLLFLH
jgi:hypothetical protein